MNMHKKLLTRIIEFKCINSFRGQPPNLESTGQISTASTGVISNY